MPAGIVDADGIVIEIQLWDPAGGAGTESAIGRPGWIGRPEQVTRAGRPGELQRRDVGGGRILCRARERRECPLDRLGVDQAGVDGQGLVGVLAVEAKAHGPATMQHVELAANAIAPGIVHSQDIDAIEGEVQVSTLELAMEHLPLLGQLLRIREVLQLTSAASGLEIRARRIDARGRRIEDRGRLGAPEVLTAMRHFGLDRFARDGTFDEHDAAVDARDRRPAVGELDDRELHYAIFARSDASSRCGLARPLEIFIPWPIRNFKARSFPALKSATDWAFSAMTWSAMASSSASPLIWLEPLSAVSAGPGSCSRYMISNVSLAILPLMTPESISWISSCTCAGLTDDCSISFRSALSSRLKSPRIQLAAALAGAPSRTVSSKKPAIGLDEVSSEASYGVRPYAVMKRCRRAAGSSGRPARISATHSWLTSSGGRSGSGKYR